MRVSVSVDGRVVAGRELDERRAPRAAALPTRRARRAPPARSAARVSPARARRPASAGVDERAEAERHRPRPRLLDAARSPRSLLDEPLGLVPAARRGTRRTRRWACRSARQSSSPRTRYHSSSTAWRARAASKSSIEWKWISGITLFGAPAPPSPRAPATARAAPAAVRSPEQRPAQNRSITTEATAPGARSGSSASSAASACSTARAGSCATV